MKKNRIKGLTLVELIIVITIVGILAGASSMYIKETIDMWRFMTFRSEIVSQGRLAVMRMAREIRQVRDGFSVYNTTNANQFSFTDVHETDDRRIAFRLTGTQLKRTLIDTDGNQTNDDTLASGVTSLVFVYYDKTGQAITPVFSPTNIYWVKMSVVLSSGTQSKTLTIMVHPRNLN